MSAVLSQASPTPDLAAVKARQQAAWSTGNYAVVGTPHRDGDKLYNSATVFDPSGKVFERYHKIQLAEPWPTPVV